MNQQKTIDDVSNQSHTSITTNADSRALLIPSITGDLSVAEAVGRLGRQCPVREVSLRELMTTANTRTRTH